MRTTRVLGTLLVASTLGAPARAADPCTSAQPEAGVPVRAPLGPADFGTLPEACGATELELVGRLGLTIATADFYGQVQAGGAVRGRLLLPGGSWLSASLPGVDWRHVVNATISTNRTDLSASTLGWHHPLPLSPRLQLAPYVRLLLPTETVFQNAVRYGLEQGIATVARLDPMLELVGGYALPLVLTSNGAATEPLLLPTVSFDAGFRPWSWLELVGGMAVRTAATDADEPLEGIDPRVAIRLYPWRGLLFDLASAFPLGGRDRTLAGAALTVGWVFERE